MDADAQPPNRLPFQVGQVLKKLSQKRSRDRIKELCSAGYKVGRHVMADGTQVILKTRRKKNVTFKDICK